MKVWTLISSMLSVQVESRPDFRIISTELSKYYSTLLDYDKQEEEKQRMIDGICQNLLLSKDPTCILCGVNKRTISMIEKGDAIVFMGHTEFINSGKKAHYQLGKVLEVGPGRYSQVSTIFKKAKNYHFNILSKFDH